VAKVPAQAAVADEVARVPAPVAADVVVKVQEEAVKVPAAQAAADEVVKVPAVADRVVKEVTVAEMDQVAPADQVVPAAQAVVVALAEG